MHTAYEQGEGREVDVPLCVLCRNNDTFALHSWHTLNGCYNRPSALFNGRNGVLRAFYLVQQTLSGSGWALCCCAGIYKVCFQTSCIYSSAEVLALPAEHDLLTYK